MSLIHEREKLRQKTKQSSELEFAYVDKTGKAWPVYGSTLTEYSSRFEPVLKGQTLEGIFNERRYRRSTVSALELCGDGEVLRTAPITRGVAVTLNDFRSTFTKVYDWVFDIKVLEGSLLEPQTWRQVHQKARGGFDFILMDPNGGWDGLRPRGEWNDSPSPEYVNFFVYRYIRKMWRVLHPNGGELFLKIDRVEDSTLKELRIYLAVLEDKYNIQLVFPSDSNLLRMKRTQTNVNCLPIMSDLESYRSGRFIGSGE